MQRIATKPGMTIALAGRRTDPLNARDIRFPVENISLVHQRVRRFLIEHQVHTLVCSAAAGADLIALHEGLAQGLQCEMILPHESRVFRDHSVTDRPGPWGPMFDRSYDELSSTGHVTSLSLTLDH